MSKTVRVGIIGVNAESGWARDGHVPAVQKLDGLVLAAVAASSQKSANASARAFNVPAAYASGQELIRAPDIDLVTIATRVPDHRELILAALSAGKHVYSEWPLGAGLAQAQEIAAAARTAGVHCAVGLQLRGSPVVRRAHALMQSGAVGRLLGVSAYSATAGFGPEVPEPFLYLEKPENFANLVTIQGAHTIDLAILLAGALRDLCALTTAQYPEIKAGDAGERRSRMTFDHMLMQGRIQTGGTLSIEVAGGRPPETPFRLNITGETGVLRLEGGAARGFQSGRLTLSLNGEPQHIDEGELAGMPDAAANVAGIYAALRDDIARDTFTVAGFDHATKLTRLVADVFTSSREGRTLSAMDWPTA